MISKRMAIVSGVMVVLLLGGLLAYALAQAPGGFQGGGAGAQGAQGGQGNRPMMGGMRGMMGMMGGAAIAVSGDAVFVVRGNTLFKFDAETLELLAQAEMPMPEMPQMPGGPPPAAQ